MQVSALAKGSASCMGKTVTQSSQCLSPPRSMCKVKAAHKPSGLHHHNLSWFPYREATRSITTPSGWDASSLQINYPPVFHQVTLTVHRYPFILLNGVRHCESKVSCPCLQHNDPSRARTQVFRSGVQCTILAILGHCIYHWQIVKAV